MHKIKFEIFEIFDTKTHFEDKERKTEMEMEKPYREGKIIPNSQTGKITTDKKEKY